MKSGSADFSLPVKIWGTNRDGFNFCELARAQEFSESDALLENIDQRLEPGTVVGIQYKENKARARVVWILEAGTTESLKIRIRLLDPATCPWRCVLSTQNQESSLVRERRRSARFKIPLPLELRQKYGRAPLHASASDISTGGCYIETLLPLPVGTQLDITIWLGHDRLFTEGIVKTCDPAVGMGIEFAGLTGEETDRLAQVLQSKSGLGEIADLHEDRSAKIEDVEKKSAYRTASGSSS